MSIKAKQVAGVTTLVVLVVAGMIAVQIASLTRLRIDETASRATTLKESMLHHAGVVVRSAGTTDPYVAIRNDSGMRSILESAVTSLPDNNTILYAAIVDPKGIAFVHSSPSLEGEPTPELEDLNEIVDARAIYQLLVRLPGTPLRAARADPRRRHRLRRDSHRRVDAVRAR